MTKEQTITSGARQYTLPSSGPRGMLDGWAVVLTATETILVLFETVPYDQKISVAARSRHIMLFFGSRMPWPRPRSSAGAWSVAWRLQS